MPSFQILIKKKKMGVETSQLIIEFKFEYRE